VLDRKHVKRAIDSVSVPQDNVEALEDALLGVLRFDAFTFQADGECLASVAEVISFDCDRELSLVSP
jgi:hypothetical protein